MKPTRFSNLFASALVFSMAAANAGTTPAAPTAPAEPAAAANWITFTLGGAFVDDDDANMMRRTGTNGDFYGGIGDFKMTQSLGGAGTLTMDGHALYGLEDYELNMLLTKEGVGYVKFTYDQFRTWYDGSGGFSPLAGNRWVAPWDDERHLDRMSLGLEAGLRMENLPEVTFSYNYHTREGQKDSLAWSDNVTAPAFKLVPALWNLDEEVHTFELDVAHTVGKTDLELGLTYEHASIDGSRYTPRGINTVNLSDSVSSDLFAGHFSSVTRFSDKLWLTFGAAYTTMDSDLDGGSRLYTYGAGPTARGVRDYAYTGMTGGSQLGHFVTNLSVMWTPVQDLTITPSLRYEHETITSSAGFITSTPVDLDNDGVVTNLEKWNAAAIQHKGAQALNRDVEMDSTTAAIEARYTGIENLVLHGKALIGREYENVDILDVYLPGERLNTDIVIDETEMSLGANWYPTSNLSFSFGSMFAHRDQGLNHRQSNATPASPAVTGLSIAAQNAFALPTTAPGNTPAQNAALVAARNAAINALPAAEFDAVLAATAAAGGANNLRPIMTRHETETTGLNLRATWRPASCVTLVTRYDYRETDFSNRGVAWTAPTAPTILPPINSGWITSHIISQSVTWSPLAQMYVQGSVSWVSSETTTPVRATTPDVDNDYLTCGATVGYAISDTTDISASYNYYGSSDYAVVANSMGYGLNTEEHVFGVTLNHMITPSMLWTLGYSYIVSDTDGLDQTGGNNDFDAHMVSTGLQIRF